MTELKQPRSVTAINRALVENEGANCLHVLLVPTERLLLLLLMRMMMMVLIIQVGSMAGCTAVCVRQLISAADHSSVITLFITASLIATVARYCASARPRSLPVLVVSEMSSRHSLVSLSVTHTLLLYTAYLVPVACSSQIL